MPSQLVFVRERETEIGIDRERERGTAAPHRVECSGSASI